MDIFVVEFWSNRAYKHIEPQLEECHEVNACHYASSAKQAKLWCKKNSDYGGHSGMMGYFPWHFRIFRHTLDVDEGSIVFSSPLNWKFICATNPNGKKRNVKY